MQDPIFKIYLSRKLFFARASYYFQAKHTIMGDIDNETKEEQTLTELVNIQLNSKPITDELLERTKLMIELCEEVFR